jgi:quinol monooxygenase YgiN
VIVVAGYFEVAEGDRRAYLDSKAAQAARTLLETGCREYAFSADDVHPGRVRLFELWDSMADLQAHLSNLRASAAAPSSVAVLSSDIQIFEATPTPFPPS